MPRKRENLKSEEMNAIQGQLLADAAKILGYETSISAREFIKKRYEPDISVVGGVVQVKPELIEEAIEAEKIDNRKKAKKLSTPSVAPTTPFKLVRTNLANARAFSVIETHLLLTDFKYEGILPRSTGGRKIA